MVPCKTTDGHNGCALQHKMGRVKQRHNTINKWAQYNNATQLGKMACELMEGSESEEGARARHEDFSESGNGLAILLPHNTTQQQPDLPIANPPTNERSYSLANHYWST